MPKRRWLRSIACAYDISQNLRWRTNHTTVTGFTNNVLNQLTALNANARTHDRRGNLLSNVQTGETLLCSWDDESQLTSVRVDPPSSLAVQSWRIDFVYDGLRRLRRMVQYTWNGSAWTSQGEVRYLNDGMLMVQERNAENAPQLQYSRGVDLSGTIHGAGGIGGLLMRSHGLSGTNWSSHNAYHSDANGNVTALVNSSGVLQASYKYNPYGGLISSSGTLASANRMRFSSKPAIFSTSGAWGFYYYGYRFYDPLNQRWLNRDPIGEAGGGNMYQFVLNNPLNRIDALGEYTLGFGGQCSIGAILGVELSGGLFFGYDPGTGTWSFGVLFSPGAGLQTPTAGATGFVQATAAPTVGDLRGSGAHIGGSFTPGLNIGGEFLLKPTRKGASPLGAQLDFGFGLSLPIPAESHCYSTYTVGPAWSW